MANENRGFLNRFLSYERDMYDRANESLGLFSSANIYTKYIVSFHTFKLCSNSNNHRNKQHRSSRIHLLK